MNINERKELATAFLYSQAENYFMINYLDHKLPQHRKEIKHATENGLGTNLWPLITHLLKLEYSYEFVNSVTAHFVVNILLLEYPKTKEQYHDILFDNIQQYVDWLVDNNGNLLKKPFNLK